MAVARGVREYATSVAGREQLAVEAFADAVETLPRTLAGNAGHDPVDAVTALRSAHADGSASIGLDIESGDPVDAWGAGVVEPRRVFSQAVETAAGVTEQLLTVDAVLLPEVDLDSFDPLTEHE
jgi:chaperonin GroEL (HSP60 family)